MWQAKHSEGFVEVEHGYAKLLKCEDGLKWSSLIVAPDTGDIWTALKSAIPSFFAPKAVLNFVCAANAGVEVLEFPMNSTDIDIEGNIRVNRKELFNVSDDIYFKLRNIGVDHVKKNRSVKVSYITLPMIESIKELCQTTGVKLGKITTQTDSLIGAIKRQYNITGNDVHICIQIAYARVYVIVFRGSEVVSVRAQLTGSIRELENILFAGYSLPKEETRLMLAGRHPEPVPAILDTIRETRLDLITQLGGVFAELRTKKMLSNESQVFLSFNIVDDSTIANMISERFDIKVNVMTGMTNDENAEKYEDFPAAWLCGASDMSAVSLIPPVKISLKSYVFTPVSAVILGVLFTSIPYFLLTNQRAATEAQLADLREKHKPVEALKTESKALEEYQTKINALSKPVEDTLNNRGLSAEIARQATENLPESTRLESLNVDYKSAKAKIVGYTIDAESALRYLDNIRQFKAFSKCEIEIADLETRRIKFTITCIIGDGKGRK